MSVATIPFKVPLEYLAQVEAGEMVRYGTVLRNAADGRIVAHLQETGVFGKVLELATSGVGEVVKSGLSPVNMLASVATVAQNEQIKGRLNTLTDMVGNLQTLSLVGSVASVAGIGVTVASTAILAQRINQVDRSISRLGGQVRGLEEKLDKLDVHRALRNIEDTMEKLAEAPFRKTQSGTEKVLGDVEENLRSGFNELADGVRMVCGWFLALKCWMRRCCARCWQGWRHVQLHNRRHSSGWTKWLWPRPTHKHRRRKSTIWVS